MPVPFAACMVLVAQIYGLPPRVLPSIQAVEGGRTGLASRNSNGTEDLGIMQINTIWLPALAHYSGITQAEVRERHLRRPCYNIAAAGLILSIQLEETGGDLMRAIGYYHSRTPVRSQAYQQRVMSSARRLFAQDR